MINRQGNKDAFPSGALVTKDKLDELLNSVVFHLDSGISHDLGQNVQLRGSLTLGGSANAIGGRGTIRWNDAINQFEGNDGTGFQPLGIGNTGNGEGWNVVGNNITIPEGQNVGIGTTTPLVPLHIQEGSGVGAGDINSGYFLLGDTGNGNIHMALDNNEIQVRRPGAVGNVATLSLQRGGGDIRLGSASSTVTVSGTLVDTSDARLKENIQPFTDGLTKLRKIKPVSYNFKGNTDKATSPRIGVLAQQLQETLPYLVHETGESIEGTPALGVQSHGLLYVMINAIKELSNKVDELETKLASKV